MAKKSARKSKKGGQRYLIRCAACREPVLLYQKDGPGGLLRMYLDRILAPPVLAAWQGEYTTKTEVPNLVCPHCEQVLAVPMIHGSDRRLAQRVIAGRVVKDKGVDSWPSDE